MSVLSATVAGMAFDARVLMTLIASPWDTTEERDAVERALHSWNTDRATREKVILLPRRWENSAVPRLGGRGQGVINEQLVDDADIVIALFDSRLGMATDEAVWGTAEEIQRAHEAGKPVHVWFSGEPIPRDADLDQVRALQEFKATLQLFGISVVLPHRKCAQNFARLARVHRLIFYGARKRQLSFRRANFPSQSQHRWRQ